MEINYYLILEKISSLIQTYGTKILYAIITLIIGWYVINFFMMLFRKLLEKRKVDLSISYFLSAIVGVILKILLFVTTISIAGIPTTSFVAALAAAGFAIGLALQGSLSNFAGGVLIIIFKPFRVGHYIEAQGVSGEVKKIDIINTVINTPDNKRIIIPNGPLANDVIINYSAEKTRRVDMIFSIGYGDDIELD